MSLYRVVLEHGSHFCDLADQSRNGSDHILQSESKSIMEDICDHKMTILRLFLQFDLSELRKSQSFLPTVHSQSLFCRRWTMGSRARGWKCMEESQQSDYNDRQLCVGVEKKTMAANSILFQSNQRFASLMVLSIGGGPALMERSTIKQQWIQMNLFQLSAIIQHPNWLDRQGECSEIRLKIRNCSSRCNLWSIGPAHLLSKLQQPLLYIQSSDLSTPRFNPVWPRDPLLCCCCSRCDPQLGGRYCMV